MFRGGFSLAFPENESSNVLVGTEQCRPQLARNGGKQKFSRPNVPLFAGQVLMLADEFGIEIPPIAQEDIRDRSKSDVFTKLFAIGQSTWLIVQCIARATHRLRK